MNVAETEKTGGKLKPYRLGGSRLLRGKELEITESWLAGESIHRLSEKYGVRWSTIGYILDNQLAEYRKQNELTTAQLCTMEVARLNMLLGALPPKIKAGNIAAINTAVKISERRSKLLGLDGYYQKNPPYDGPLVVIQPVDASDGHGE